MCNQRCQQQQTPTTADDIDTPRRLQNGSKPVNLCEGMNVQPRCLQQRTTADTSILQDVSKSCRGDRVWGLPGVSSTTYPWPPESPPRPPSSSACANAPLSQPSTLEQHKASGRLGLASCSARLHNRFVQKLVVAQTSRCLEQVQSQCKVSNLNSQSKSLGGTTAYTRKGIKGRSSSSRRTSQQARTAEKKPKKAEKSRTKAEKKL